MALREIWFFLEKIQRAFNFCPTLPHKKNIWMKGRGVIPSLILYVVSSLLDDRYMRCFVLLWKGRGDTGSHMFFP